MTEITEIKIPFSGSVENVEVTEWLVSAGDDVTEGQALADVATDKVDTELEAPSPGKIARLLVEAGTELKVGDAVALLAPSEASDEDVQQALAAYDAREDG